MFNSQLTQGSTFAISTLISDVNFDNLQHNSPKWQRGDELIWIVRISSIYLK